MKIIFGLGNPGSDYEGTRHNTGFMAVNAFAKEQGAQFTEKTKFQAYIAELNFEGEKVLLVKPTTFYNEVGISARALVDFYKLTQPDDLLVIHDDLALPFGTIRVRRKGSDAGNNGIKSLNAHIGHEYFRLRIGIAPEKRQQSDTEFVLGKFYSEEVEHFKEVVIPRVREITNQFIQHRLEDTSYSQAPA